MVTIHRCTISFWLYRPVIQCGRSKTGRSTRNWSNWSIWVRDCKKYLCCDYWEKQRAICQTTAKYNRNSRGIFPCIVSFTDNPAIIFPVDHSKQMMQMIYIQTIPNESWCEAYMMYAVCGTNFVYRVFLS